MKTSSARQNARIGDTITLAGPNETARSSCTSSEVVRDYSWSRGTIFMDRKTLLQLFMMTSLTCVMSS